MALTKVTHHLVDGIEAGADVTDTTNVVAALSAGTGISLSTGGVIANTSPDQTVALTGAGATSISGSYPNFTITSTDTNTDTDTTYTAGSGLSLTGTEFANTAPDQTVSLTGAGTTTVSGTYPNFTITGSGGTYTAGTGLTLTGTEFSVDQGSGSGLDADQLDGVEATGFGRFYNNATITATTTADLITQLSNNYGAFNNNYVTVKVQWSYAGSGDLVTGHSTIGTIELAGCLIEAWGGTYKHIRITRPTTGAGGSTICVYNDQSSSYSPGWREIWTSETDGSGSGLDADTVDGLQASDFVRAKTRTNWNSSPSVIQNVVGQLGWKNYSNSHTIFDASASTSPDGTSVNNTDPSVSWTATYPTLMGWNGSNTYGVRVDRSKYAETLGGLALKSSSGDSGANQVMRSHSNGYLYMGNWIQVGTAGLYSGTNSAHLSPNTSTTYATWKTSGSKGGYDGILFDSGGDVAIMYDSAGNGGLYRQANGRWHIYHHVGNNCLGVCNSTTSSSYGLYVTGSIYSTGNITAYSDARIKENVVTIDSALEKVESMRGVYYNKIDDPDKTKEVGFIAQEVNEVIPEAVTYAEDVDQYGVKYANITALLVESVKELSEQVKDLQAEIKELKKNG